jgi:hypothetical protein
MVWEKFRISLSQFGIYREKEGPVWVEWGLLFISFL